MVNVDLVALLAIQVLYAIASLALISVGLAIIFGMMRVINLAHGEFLMLGGYAAIVATSHGISIWIAILVVAPAVVGIIGVIVEMTIMHLHEVGLWNELVIPHLSEQHFTREYVALATHHILEQAQFAR